jgi:hypothetical protein
MIGLWVVSVREEDVKPGTIFRPYKGGKDLVLRGVQTGHDGAKGLIFETGEFAMYDPGSPHGPGFFMVKFTEPFEIIEPL